MGCNCGKRKINRTNEDTFSVKKQRGAMGSRIKKIWKLTEDKSIVIKKIDNK